MDKLVDATGYGMGFKGNLFTGLYCIGFAQFSAQPCSVLFLRNEKGHSLMNWLNYSIRTGSDEDNRAFFFRNTVVQCSKIQGIIVSRENIVGLFS